MKSAAVLQGFFAQVSMYRSTMLSFLKNYDVIVCPVNALPAIEHGKSFDPEITPAFSYTVAHNLTGWPGAVVRGGTSREGLPVGVQTVARPWREDVALAVAKHLESALGGYQRPALTEASAGAT
jgi:amidase